MPTASTIPMAPGITPVIGANAGRTWLSSVLGGLAIPDESIQRPARPNTSGNPPSAIATLVSSERRPVFEPATSGIPARMRRPFNSSQNAARMKAPASDINCDAQTPAMNVRHGLAVLY